MNNSERLLFLSVQLLMLNLGNKQKKEEIVKISSELAELRLAMEREHVTYADVLSPDNGYVDGFVKFTQKEILQMPVKFRKLFVLGGCVVRAYKRCSCIRAGKEVYNYELRCRSEGYNIYASSNSFEIAKKKFLEQLKEEGEPSERQKPKNFNDFSMYYFETFNRPGQICNSTLQSHFIRECGPMSTRQRASRVTSLSP